MLRATNVSDINAAAPMPVEVEKELNLSEVIGFLRRQWVMIAVACTVSVAFAAIYVLISPPRFRATTQLIIDSRKVTPSVQRSVSSELTLDSALMDSQVEVVKSASVGLAVIDKLKLTEDPEFAGQSSFRSLVGVLVRFTGLGGFSGDADVAAANELSSQALQHLKANLTSQRVGRTYVLEISYRSLDPAKAATIANAISEAYIAQEAQANFEATKRASEWLLERITELRHQAAAADRAVQDYKAGLREAIGNTNNDPQQAGVTLRNLESSAQIYRTLHDSFVQRFVETTQQESVPKTEARVITPALKGKKSDPKTLLILGMAMMGGFLGSLGLALAREQLDRTLKTAKQVEQSVGVECLGVIPEINSREIRRQKRVGNSQKFGQKGNRSIPANLGLERQVVYSPFSRFTETMRSIKVAADLRTSAENSLVIGVISALPGEGKSTVAANLAQLLTNANHRALLIDSDLRQPSLTKRMAPDANAGLLQILDGSAAACDVIWEDPITKLHFIPAVLEKPIAYTAELIASPQMQMLLEAMQSQYEYIVLDLPPLGLVVDARAASELIDKYLLVIEWGKTPAAALMEALGPAEVIQSRLLGAVLNKANPATLKRLEPYKTAGYYEYYNNA